MPSLPFFLPYHGVPLASTLMCCRVLDVRTCKWRKMLYTVLSVLCRHETIPWSISVPLPTSWAVHGWYQHDLPNGWECVPAWPCSWQPLQTSRWDHAWFKFYRSLFFDTLPRLKVSWVCTICWLKGLWSHLKRWNGQSMLSYTDDVPGRIIPRSPMNTRSFRSRHLLIPLFGVAPLNLMPPSSWSGLPDDLHHILYEMMGSRSSSFHKSFTNHSPPGL